MESLPGKYRVVVFDLDGTLVDLNVDWQRVKGELARLSKKRFGREKNFDPLTPALLDLAREHGTGALGPFYSLIERAEHEAIRASARARGNVVGVLHRVKDSGHAWTAIFTQNFRSTAELAGRTFGFAGDVDFIVGKREVTRPKPDPEGLLVIAHQFGVAPGDLAFLGDAEVDLEAGRRAGVDTFLVKN
ncbi:MAG: HAD family hydrolase [Promethearchaeota archaeon]